MCETLVFNNLGNTYNSVNKLDKAILNYEKALEIKPDYEEANFNLATILYKVGQFDKSAELFKKDRSAKSQNALLQCQFALNNQSSFYNQLDDLINQGNNNAVIGSYVSRSNIRYGMQRTNPFCNEPLEYVLKYDLSSECDFQKDFVKGAFDILNNKSINERDQNLLTNGKQTAGNVFTQVGDVTDKIQNIIRDQIEKYHLHFKNSKEGLITSWPANYEIYGWLVSMKSGGELAPHMHEQGWLSGSIYINVPPKIHKDSGNLVVSLDKDEHKEKYSKSIDVITGSICLFPSSLWHYTIPFEGTEDRVVLAFDVVPISSQP